MAALARTASALITLMSSSSSSSGGGGGGESSSAATKSTPQLTPAYTLSALRQPTPFASEGVSRPERKGDTAPAVLPTACASASRFENHRFVVMTAE
jgi:hypothetical protein